MFDPQEITRFYPQCAPCHYSRYLHTTRGFGIDMEPCGSCPRNPHRNHPGAISEDKFALSGGVMAKKYRKLEIPVLPGAPQ